MWRWGGRFENYIWCCAYIVDPNKEWGWMDDLTLFLLFHFFSASFCRHCKYSWPRDRNKEERWKGGGSQRGGGNQRGGVSNRTGPAALVPQRPAVWFRIFWLHRTPSEAFTEAKWYENGPHLRINNHVSSFGIEKRVLKLQVRISRKWSVSSAWLLAGIGVSHHPDKARLVVFSYGRNIFILNLGQPHKPLLVFCVFNWNSGLLSAVVLLKGLAVTLALAYLSERFKNHIISLIYWRLNKSTEKLIYLAWIKKSNQSLMTDKANEPNDLLLQKKVDIVSAGQV